MARSSGGSVCGQRVRRWPNSDIACAGWIGQGLASEGASALVKWGFTSGGYDKIVATTMAVNHASRRVMEKIGLKYERTVSGDWPDSFPGSEHGEVWYEMVRSEWNGS